MKAAVRPLALLAAPVVAAVLVAVAWQGSSVGASRPPAVRVQNHTQTRVETQVVTATETQTQTKVVKDTNGIEQVSAQIAALQQTVTANAEAAANQVAALNRTITALQGTVSALQSGLANAQANTTAQTKKVTDLAAMLTDANNRLVALQALVTDKLQHPSPVPTH